MKLVSRYTAVLAFVSMSADAFQARTLSNGVGRPTTILEAKPDQSTGSVGSRRSFLVASTAFAFSSAISSNNPANAKYGDSSTMELPNYIDYLIEKNNAGVAQGNVLYKGADPVVLLGRLQESNKRLGDIQDLAEQKKWSQIQGIITGPLGTLSQTLNQIATPDSSTKVREAAKKLKGVVIEIGQAASKKKGDVCTAKALQASQELEAFVKAAFEWKRFK